MKADVKGNQLFQLIEKLPAECDIAIARCLQLSYLIKTFTKPISWTFDKIELFRVLCRVPKRTDVHWIQGKLNRISAIDSQSFAIMYSPCLVHRMQSVSPV